MDDATTPRSEAATRRTARQHATTMMLYVAVVVLAELAALPTGEDGRQLHGPTGWELAAIVWGTTIGLALAHAFAFQVAVHGLSRGRLLYEDRVEVVAEVAGAAFVAAVGTVPIWLFAGALEQRAVALTLVLIVGVVSYFVERENGRSRVASFVFAGATLAIGVLVVTVKMLLAYH